MDKYKTIRRMIEKECQRTSLADLCEYWGVTCDDFYNFLDAAKPRGEQNHAETD
jgi:hypothetical protein